MVQDSGNHGQFRRLEKFVNGVGIVMAEDKNGYSPGQLYHMQFKDIGNTLEFGWTAAKFYRPLIKQSQENLE